MPEFQLSFSIHGLKNIGTDIFLVFYSEKFTILLYFFAFKHDLKVEYKYIRLNNGLNILLVNNQTANSLHLTFCVKATKECLLMSFCSS